MAKKKNEEEEKPDAPSGGSIAVNDAWTGMLAISLLALMIGTGFLAYDYMQYSDKDLPKVPKLTGAPPGAPVIAPKVDAPKEEKKAEEKKAEEKKE